MNIRLVGTDLVHKEVILCCENGRGNTDIDFYVIALFDNNKIDFSIQCTSIYKHAEVLKVFAMEKDFIEKTAKMFFQDALNRCLGDTSTTMLFYKDNGDKEKMYVLNPMLQTHLKQLLIDWYNDKWCVADIEWSAIEHYGFCPIRSTVALPKEKDCNILEGFRILTNCGLGEISKVKFL